MNDKTVPSYVYLKHPVTGEDCTYPGTFQQKHLNAAIKYQAKQSDIFICSAPKCGSTWLQTIVWLIVHEGEMFNGDIRKNIPMLEFHGSEAVEKIDASVYPRIIKTHFKHSWVPYHHDAKYIYVTRNPKDALVSYYYHCKGFKDVFDCEDLDFDKLFDLYVNDDVEFWGYFNHVTDWYLRRNEPNVLFLLYEDLKLNPGTEILKVAEFLGGEPYQALKENEKLLQTIVEKSSFSSMKVAVVRKDRPDDLPFVRKGQVGDWKNHLSATQSEIMEKMMRKAGGMSGWDQLWDNHDGVWENKKL